MTVLKFKGDMQYQARSCRTKCIVLARVDYIIYISSTQAGRLVYEKHHFDQMVHPTIVRLLVVIKLPKTLSKFLLKHPQKYLYFSYFNAVKNKEQNKYIKSMTRYGLLQTDRGL